MYMLDTNICSYIIKKQIDAKEFLEKVDYKINISSIVMAELLFGSIKKGSPRLKKVIDSFLESAVVYDFDKNAAIEYAKIRAKLEKDGKIIGSNDLLIAAHALSLNATLITNNIKEFGRVSNLKIEQLS